MNYLEFIYKLQYQPMDLMPKDWLNNYKSIEVPFKIYRNPYYTLPPIPPTKVANISRSMDPINYLSILLKYSYGLININWQTINSKILQTSDSVMRFFRRPIPSGGALYPCEIYLYIKGISGLENGIYHYNVPHHQLMLIKGGLFDHELKESCHSIEISDQCILGMISVVYWRNMFKYSYFSYRLQPQDVGVLLAQLYCVIDELFLEFSFKFDFSYFNIADLLDINLDEECVFALFNLDIIDLAWQSCDIPLTKYRETKSGETIVSDTNLITNFEDYYSAIKYTIESPIPIKKPYITTCKIQSSKTYTLPKANMLSIDIIKASRDRVSPGDRYNQKPVTLQQLSDLLFNAMQLFKQKITSDHQDTTNGFSVYISLKDIPELNDGTYQYCGELHQLHLVNEANPFHYLDSCMTRRNINLQLLNTCMHIAVDKSLVLDENNPRQYRITLMLAGMLYQLIQILATSLGLGAHILMSFDTAKIEALYKANDNNQIIIGQIAIGNYNLLTRLTGSLP